MNTENLNFTPAEKVWLLAAEFAARDAHVGQFRRDGVTPYIAHVERVVKRLSRLPGVSAGQLAAAWLHDVLEDTSVTVDGLHAVGIPIFVTNSVVLLTHRPGELYRHQIERLVSYPETAVIKIADILDNLSDNPTQRQIVKYSMALLVLAKHWPVGIRP